jgi:transposase
MPSKLSLRENTAERLIKAAEGLRDGVSQLRFAPPVTHVYNPLDYAWAAHEEYLRPSSPPFTASVIALIT